MGDGSQAPVGDRPGRQGRGPPGSSFSLGAGLGASSLLAHPGQFPDNRNRLAAPETLFPLRTLTRLIPPAQSSLPSGKSSLTRGSVLPTKAVRPLQAVPSRHLPLPAVICLSLVPVGVCPSARGKLPAGRYWSFSPALSLQLAEWALARGGHSMSIC